MLKIAVVDDDSQFRADVRSALGRCLGGSPQWSLVEYPDSETFHREFSGTRPDIVLLDIMLPGENGIDAARRIYAADKRTLILFVTSSPDFALHGYGVNAVGYLLKPLDNKRLADALRDCRGRLDENPPPRLVVKCGNRVRQIDLAAISHLESANRKVRIHAAGETLDCQGKLAEYIEQIPGAFLRVHTSFAVNAARVRELGYYTVLLDDGATVPVSRTYRQRTRDGFFSRLAEEERRRKC